MTICKFETLREWQLFGSLSSGTILGIQNGWPKSWESWATLRSHVEPSGKATTEYNPLMTIYCHSQKQPSWIFPLSPELMWLQCKLSKQWSPLRALRCRAIIEQHSTSKETQWHSMIWDTMSTIFQSLTQIHVIDVMVLEKHDFEKF